MILQLLTIIPNCYQYTSTFKLLNSVRHLPNIIRLDGSWIQKYLSKLLNKIFYIYTNDNKLISYFYHSPTKNKIKLLDNEINRLKINIEQYPNIINLKAGFNRFYNNN